MGLTKEQVETLIQLVCVTTPDNLDCDGCCEQIAEFAETVLKGKSRSESMKLVEAHLVNCPCCKDEFEALRLALSVSLES